MPAQINFPDKLQKQPNFRPRRVAIKDRILIQETDDLGNFVEKEVVFGQSVRDVVEIYVYDELNDIVGHVTVEASDSEALRLIAFVPNQQVGVGQDQTPDVLQVDLKNVLKRMGPSNPETGEPEGLPPGRYSIAINIFRNEVGSEFGGNNRRLFIQDISSSRTELRLVPVTATQKMANEISEFVDPSVPRFVAQAIIDQTFGVSLNFELGESVTFQEFENEVERTDQIAENVGENSTAERLKRASLAELFYTFFDDSLSVIRDETLNELAAVSSGSAGGLQIQDIELQKFIRDGVAKALISLVSRGKLDARIQLLDRNGNPITQTST